MTYNKQIKELQVLIEKLGKDFVIYNFLDNWVFELEGDMGIKRKNVIRESVILGDIYDQFINKTGDFYNFLKPTDEFRSFIQMISGKFYEPKEYYRYYEDSYNKFMEEWNKLHPEISYEEYEKKERQKDSLRWGQIMNLFRPYYDAYDSLFSNDYFHLRNILA